MNLRARLARLEDSTPGRRSLAVLSTLPFELWTDRELAEAAYGLHHVPHHILQKMAVATDAEAAIIFETWEASR